MKRRFVIGTQNTTKDHEQLFINNLRAHSLIWWHWLPNTWLVIDLQGLKKSSDIRAIFKEVVPNINCLVIEVDSPSKWSGFGPASEDRNMFRWIHNNWDKP